MVFLPSKTTPLMQPIDRAVIAAFKAYYLQRTFAQAFAATEGNTDAILEGLHIGCIKNLAWAFDDVTKECMNGIWKETPKRFVCDFKGFVKDEGFAEINKAVIEKANNFNLCVEELEVVPEELTNELLGLEQEHIPKEKPREK